MLRLAADENFSGRIVRALARRIPDLDLVRVQDTELVGAGDHQLLAWSAAAGRVLLTHDVTTITAAAIQRIAAGQEMPGVVEVRQELPIGSVVEDLVLLVSAAQKEDCSGRILYLPL